MKIIGKKLSLAEFQEYTKNKDFGVLPPTFLVLHHTWKPTKDQWAGDKSIKGLKSYYESLGWSDGPHLFIAEDGIWLFTDMYDVGIHAGEGNGTLKTGYSIGIEVVGNYDKEVWSGETYSNTVGAIKALQEKLGIPDNKIKFHRDYSTKSCPGWAITKEWVLEQINTNTKEMATKYYINSDLRNELKKFDKDFDHEKEKDHKKMAELLADASKRYDENVDNLMKTKAQLAELTDSNKLNAKMLADSNKKVAELTVKVKNEQQAYDALVIETDKAMAIQQELIDGMEEELRNDSINIPAMSDEEYNLTSNKIINWLKKLFRVS